MYRLPFSWLGSSLSLPSHCGETSPSRRNATARSGMTFVQSSSDLLLFEHGLRASAKRLSRRKPAPTFPDHALFRRRNAREFRDLPLEQRTIDPVSAHGQRRMGALL